MYYLLTALVIAWYLACIEKLDFKKMENHQMLLILVIAVLLYCEYTKYKLIEFAEGMESSGNKKVFKAVSVDLNNQQVISFGNGNNSYIYDEKSFATNKPELQIFIDGTVFTTQVKPLILPFKIKIKNAKSETVPAVTIPEDSSSTNANGVVSVEVTKNGIYEIDVKDNNNVIITKIH